MVTKPGGSVGPLALSLACLRYGTRSPTGAGRTAQKGAEGGGRASIGPRAARGAGDAGAWQEEGRLSRCRGPLSSFVCGW